MSSHPPIVLASSSPYRRAILERLGLEFFHCAPNIDESYRRAEPPDDLVRRLSIAKASAVAGLYPRSLVIGADQLAVLDGQIMGKPANHMEAIYQLRSASGSCMTLHCGIAVLNTATEQVQSGVEHVDVEYRTLTTSEIYRYLAVDQPYDCCGSLKAEGLGISLLHRIRSNDPHAITGLPALRLLSMLRNEGIAIP